MAEKTLPDEPDQLLELTCDVVAAYVSNNKIAPDQIVEFMSAVHATLESLRRSATAGSNAQAPAVDISESITPDYIVCLEDGKKLQMLKRYLNVQYGLTPDEYRRKWGLPADYPMVAPKFAKRRAQIAKKIGLGKSSGAAQQKRTKRKTRKSVRK